MPHDRFYLDQDYYKETLVALEESEWHHLAHVSRAKVGDPVELVNGKGQLANASVRQLKKRGAELWIEEVHTDTAQKPPLILALAIPKKNHLEWVIEKGTELGATAFWLFPGMLSDKDQLSPSQELRLHNLAISAMKQCGRLDAPVIEKKASLLEWEKMEGTLLFGDTAPDAPYLWDLSLKKPLPPPTIFLIGPERGFSSKEEEHLRTALGAQGVRLHSNILRAETAPLVALSLLGPYTQQTKSIK